MNFFTTTDLLGRSGPFSSSIDYIVWYAVFVLATIGLVWFLAKKKSMRATKITLIVCYAIAVAFDIGKYIITLSNGFDIGGDLPFYICSLFLFITPVAIWGKGKFKSMACTYTCTVGFFGAIMNYIIPSTTVTHSLFSYLGLHTTIYHSILMLVPMIMLCTGYHKIQFKKFGWDFLGFVVITFPIIIFNWIAKTDYMYFNTAEMTQLGFIMNIASATSYAWPLLMYVAYAAVYAVMGGIIVGITALVNVIIKATKKEKVVANVNAVEEKEETKTEEIKAEQQKKKPGRPKKVEQ